MVRRRKYLPRWDRRVIAADEGPPEHAPTAPNPKGSGDRKRDRRTEVTWDMAGQAPRGSRGHGRSSRPGSSLPRAATSGAARGLVPTPPPATRSIPSAPSMPTTRSVYRLLLLKGLTPVEASALTAFMCGLPTTDLN